MSSPAIKRIAVLTSGGDAPGMNAAIRAVTRRALFENIEVVGFYRGFQGLIEGDCIRLQPRDVGDIIQRGGTILKTSRCPQFMQAAGRKKAFQQLQEKDIQGLVVIGGDGSFRGLIELHNEHHFPVIGIPGTIDNDIYGSDTIGFDTAVNTALSLIDRIRDTAHSHDRFFIVEVMGRHSGFIAQMVGLAGGAEWIFTPEIKDELEPACQFLKSQRERGKSSSIIVVAEGEQEGGAFEIGRKINERTGFQYRVCVLGHTQRGGSPTARDRALASLLGAAAVEALIDQESCCMVGEQGNQLVRVDLHDAVQKSKESHLAWVNLSKMLA